MKKVMIAVLLVVAAVTAQAQTPAQMQTVQYLVGCENKGYPLKVETDTINFDSKAHRAPVLYNYVVNKNLYVGGTLVNQRGDSTKIVDIVIEETGPYHVKFTVKGEKFSKTLRTDKESHILSKTNKLTKFFCAGDTWTIIKK